MPVDWACLTVVFTIHQWLGVQCVIDFPIFSFLPSQLRFGLAIHVSRFFGQGRISYGCGRGKISIAFLTRHTFCTSFCSCSKLTKGSFIAYHVIGKLNRKKMPILENPALTSSRHCFLLMY